MVARVFNVKWHGYENSSHPIGYQGEVFRVELRLESEVDRYCTVVTRSFLATQTKLETVNMFSKLLSPFTKQNAVRSEEADDFLKSSG